MPRLSLYKPEKGADFRFIDRAINEQFQIGGTDIYIHKSLGPVNPAEGESTPALPVNSNDILELGIQDLIFMENRDRHYDPDVYVIRGIYTMQDIDFNLSQFGLFLTNDNIMLTFHLRNTVDTLGRKIMAGDVLELYEVFVLPLLLKLNAINFAVPSVIVTVSSADANDVVCDAALSPE